MFYFCNSLTSLDVSGWDTSAVTSMSTMFYSCNSLTSLDVSGWDTSAVTSMSSMFYSCNSLTSLDVSNWDFSKVTTASNASGMFRYCRGLHGSITLPASVTQIGTYCFGDTRSLYEYHFLSTTPPALANTNAFNNMTDFGGKKIYVPAASLEAYKTATNWSTYASYMQGE
jgi:surface protein